MEKTSRVLTQHSDVQVWISRPLILFSHLLYSSRVRYVCSSLPSWNIVTKPCGEIGLHLTIPEKKRRSRYRMINSINRILSPIKSTMYVAVSGYSNPRYSRTIYRGSALFIGTFFSGYCGLF